MCGITRIQDYFRDTQVPDKISVVVSIGCGLMDPVPLGETDIQDYLFFWRKSHNPIKIVREAKNLVTMLSEAVSVFLCPLTCIIFVSDHECRAGSQ